MRYSVLDGKIKERGIKRTAISSALGISARTLFDKINGSSEFTWSQVCAIQCKFFPDIPKEELFKRDDEI